MNKQAINGKLLEAARSLEKAASTITALRDDKKNLQMDNTRLKLAVIASERSKRASDLADEMFIKGMISKGDVLNKAKEIMTYNDEAFDVLKNAVKKTVVDEDNDSSFRVDRSEINKEAAEAINYNRNAASKNLVADKINNLQNI